jgi:ParB family chromosome partitioning protein
MKVRDANLGSLKKAKESGRDDISLTKVTVYAVAPEDLEIEEGWNERDMTPRVRAHIDSIKETIRSGGYIPPLNVRVSGTHVYVREGHCRLTAIRELIAEGFEIRRVMVEEVKGNDADDVALMITSDGTLKKTRLEQGRGCKRLISFGWTAKEVAARVGQSLTYVEQNLMLANANSDLHLLLVSESVSYKIALDAIRKHGDKAGAVLAARLLAASEKGQTKLTGSTLKRALPPKLVRHMADSVSGIFADVTDLYRARITEAADDAMISVSAAHMKNLLAAHDAMLAATHVEVEPQEAG